jgi:penicillin-binding protein 1B
VRVNKTKGFIGVVFLTLIAIVAAVVLVIAVIFSYYWVSYSRKLNQRLASNVTHSTAGIFTTPSKIGTGEALSLSELVENLNRAGYGNSRDVNAPGWYSSQPDTVEIHPQQRSYFKGKNALRVQFAGGKIRSIRLLDDGSTAPVAEIEPELLTNLFGTSREKRRNVRFDDIPKVVVNAVLSAEDKRFFEHPGFDVIRILGAAWADVRYGGKAQGASTLTMQVARSLFLSNDRTWTRKATEVLVSLELEHRFTKKQIFELYANEIYLGNRGSFAIHGFSEGALAYFAKDLHDLSVGEAAFMAGIIRAPNRYSSAERYPQRAADARDRVLNQMLENRYITAQDVRAAKAVPLHVVPGGLGNSEAPYFVDMVQDDLLEHYSEAELASNSFRIYTTLDATLERAASRAVSIGMASIDKQLAQRYARWRKQGHPAEAQVAMIAVDPHSGEIRALIGGRDYGRSQLNHVLAKRQPGSVFKPFVYAAAFDNAVRRLSPVVTPATTVEDEPTTFDSGGTDYIPNNYGTNFRGTVTLREALTLSLNVATVKVAEMIGYSRVVQEVRRLGFEDDVKPTPAVALGAYEMTPLEVAAGYTVFANGGVRTEPRYIDAIMNASGKVIRHSDLRAKQVLDPRVAYQLTSIMEDVLNRGTGATVRTRGFRGPAAGKTGTSRDGWFAGYTSNLLCIVWVGFDDNRDLALSGSNSAALIWAEFMKAATTLPAYHDVREFAIPEGMKVAEIDPETGQLATPSCPMRHAELFIAGTEPVQFCELHGGHRSTLSRIFGGGNTESEKNAHDVAAASERSRDGAVSRTHTGEKSRTAVANKNHHGLLHRIFGVFTN